MSEKAPGLVLGIETSCDETAAAVVADGRRILSNVVASQARVHSAYGGVVPELASRHHVEAIAPVIEAAMAESGARFEDLAAVAVTQGPGLVGSLLVGLQAAKAIALVHAKPLVPVHHVAGHVAAAFLANGEIPLPAIALVVSGGHTSLYEVPEEGVHRLLGRTRDDAAGEAFDKVAKLLGLGFPGGPAIEREARAGDPAAIPFPRPMLGSPDHDVSFSGLKTAVLQWVEDRDPREVAAGLADVCASFQAAVVEVLVEKTAAVAAEVGSVSVILAGGVACNGALRAAMRARLPELAVVWPSPILCTDNGAMIARTARLRADEAVRPGSFDVHASLPLP